MTAAKSSETYVFFHASGECAATHGAKSNSLSVFRTFDESPVHYSGDHNTGAINSWLESQAIPMIIEFSEDYIEPIFGKGRNALILFTNDREAAFNKIYADAAK